MRSNLAFRIAAGLRRHAERSFVPLFCLLVAVSVPGLHPALAQQLSFRTYGQADGLDDPSVACLLQDESGYMLACTEHGLFVYDGRRFLNLGPEQGLPRGGVVYAAAINTDRRIILRYLHRLFVSTRPLGRAVPPDALSFQAIEAPPGSMASDDIGSLAAWDGGAIFVAHRHLYEVARAGPADAFSIRPMDGLLHHMDGVIASNTPLAVQGRTVFVALEDFRICALDPGTLHCFGTPEGLPATRWLTFQPGARGHLLARSASMLVEIDPIVGHVAVYPLPAQGGDDAGYARSPVLAMAPTGQIVTRARDGLLMRTGSDWKLIGVANGLPSGEIVSALFDHDDNLWLGMLGGGALRALGFGVWENRDRLGGQPGEAVWQVARQPSGPLWVASGGGVDALGPVRDARLARPHYDDPTYVMAFDRSGRLWRSVGRDRISCIDLARGTSTEFQTPPVNQILRGTNDELWLLTNDGLYDASQQPGVLVPPRRVPHADGRIIGGTVAADGSVWMIHGRDLLRRYPDGTLAPIRPDWPQVDFDPAAIAAAPGVVWVGGAGGGLYRLRVEGDRVAGIQVYNPPDIASNSAVALLVDSRGWVWVGTDSGISVFDNSRWVSADSGGGLIWNDIDQNGLFEDDDGSMWISTSRGLSHLLDPDSLFRRETLQPVITSAMLGDRRYLGRALTFSHDPLLLRFGILNFRIDGATRFRYRLEGVDQSWAETGGGYARYPSLPPGHHRFTVVAINPLTHEVSDPVSIVLRMRDPWWLWWPLLVSYGLLAAGAVYGLVHLRFRLLVRQRRALQRAVDEQTREIRAAQAALQLQASRDSLTALLTRGEIQRRLVEVLAHVDRPSHVTIGLLDIDHFKRINDRFGHLVGDDILRETGRRLNAALLPGEHAGRYGGEEILLVLDIAGTQGTGRIQALGRAACAELFELEDETLRVTCSIGVTQAHASDDWKSLIGRADRALYNAKAQGRDRVVEASPSLQRS